MKLFISLLLIASALFLSTFILNVQASFYVKPPADSYVVGPPVDCAEDSSSTSFGSAITEGYSIELLDLMENVRPSRVSVVQIFAAIQDDYGKTLQGNLSYSVDNGNTTIVPLQLFNGFPFNGTYFGEIPLDLDNKAIDYEISFLDEFNYKLNCNREIDLIQDSGYHMLEERFEEANEDNDGPVIEDVYIVGPQLPNEPVKVRAFVDDPESGIKNVTLKYSTIAHNDEDYSFNYTLMTYNHSFDAYEGEIPAFPEETTISWFVAAFNDQEMGTSEGLSMRDLLGEDEEDPEEWVTGSYDFFIYNPHLPYWRDTNSANEIRLITIINSIDPQDRTMNFSLFFDGNRVNWTDHLVPFPLKLVSPEETFSYELSGESLGEGLSIIKFSNQSNANKSQIDRNVINLPNLRLVGDPLSYPFDKYSLNLFIIIPHIGNINETFKQHFNDEVSSTWTAVGTIRGQTLDTASHQCRLLTFINTSLSSEVQKDQCKQFFGTNEVFNLRTDFTRNYTSLIIIFPLVAVFYLLGAIFIFENNNGNIGNRLTLSLGVFALIFTLPEIISSMKPFTIGPTIADSLLSMIMIASIGFTISSVISSNSTFQRAFPRHYGWTDSIVFIIMTIIIISSLMQYDTNILIWLIPIVILGLGYGLLIRIIKRINIKTVEKQTNLSEFLES